MIAGVLLGSVIPPLILVLLVLVRGKRLHHAFDPIVPAPPGPSPAPACPLCGEAMPPGGCPSCGAEVLAMLTWWRHLTRESPYIRDDLLAASVLLESDPAEMSLEERTRRAAARMWHALDGVVRMVPGGEPPPDLLSGTGTG